jgi:hypothetical protein
MDLPSWALRALAHFKPESLYGGDAPDTERLKQWQALDARFRRRWGELESEKWKVPDEHPRYAWLLRNYEFPPSQYVRQCILECAIESAWEMGANKSPVKVIAAVKELDALNEKISETAEILAHFFRQRDQLREGYGLSDRWKGEDEAHPDPFRLSGVLERTLSKDRFRTASYCYKDGLKTLYEALASSNGESPTIADLLDEVSWRMPRSAAPFEAGDIAVVGSRTNKSHWSPWALRLVARLSDWAGNGLPDGFFLDCLTYEQLATLAMVSVDAPPEAYSASQMKELLKRFRKRRNDSAL